MSKFPDCECGKNDYFHMPDSLAWACKGCGRVIVGTSSTGFKKGASIQKWLNDTHPEIPPMKDPDDTTPTD